MRGPINQDEYKSYVTPILFFKRISDVYDEEYADALAFSGGDTEYAEAEDAKQLSRLAENLDCFTFIVGASNYEEVGIYVTENNENFSVNPSVEKFFDYKAFGKYIGDAYYGEFVDGGFIYNDTDTSLLDILYQDEPMTMGGM